MITRINEQAGASVTKLVGNTPLLELPSISAEVPGVRVFGKAEWYNPGGSVKDRPALWMIRDGERSGALTPEKTILDATSGNTGIAYAWIGAALGYRVRLCMPKNASEERKKILRAYGVDFVLTDPGEGSDGAIREARRLYAEESEKYFYPDQYSNPANPRSHYESTAPEIWEQTNGEITHFVAGLGTTGTLMGVSRFFRATKPEVKIVAAEPRYGELVYGLRNLDEGFVPELYDATLIDSRFSVGPRDAVRRTRELLELEGIFAGISTGAILHAALGQAAKAVKAGETADIAFVVADGGWKYLSTGAYEGTIDEAEDRLEGQLWA